MSKVLKQMTEVDGYHVGVQRKSSPNGLFNE